MKVFTYAAAYENGEWFVTGNKDKIPRWRKIFLPEKLAAIKAITERDRFIIHGALVGKRLTVFKVLFSENVDALAQGSPQRDIWDMIFDGTYPDPTRSECAYYLPPRDVYRGQSRVPKIGHESPPGSGRWKR